MKPAEKLCPDCKVNKPVASFGPHKATKDRLQWSCRECATRRRSESRKRNIERHHEVQRAWRRRNVEKRQLYDLRQIAKRFGIEKAQYFAMVLAQNGVCRICGKHESITGRRLSVDHDHTSGRVRGLLCSNCNLGIGYFYDDPELLRRAAQYIDEARDRLENQGCIEETA